MIFPNSLTSRGRQVSLNPKALDLQLKFCAHRGRLEENWEGSVPDAYTLLLFTP